MPIYAKVIKRAAPNENKGRNKCADSNLFYGRQEAQAER